MNPSLNSDGAAVRRFVRQLHLRFPRTPKTYQGILNGFHRFVKEHVVGEALSVAVIQAWLRDRITVWPLSTVLHHTRLLDRFLDWRVAAGSLQSNPLAELGKQYGQQATAPIVRALLSPDPTTALEALRPLPRFASFLGMVMQDHVALKRAMGHRYDADERGLLRFDRFLQGRPDLSGQPLKVLVNEWTSAGATTEHAWRCNQVARVLSKALRRIDPKIELVPLDRDLERRARQAHRRPYICSEEEVRRIGGISCLFRVETCGPDRHSSLCWPLYRF